MSEVKKKYTNIGTVKQARKKDPNDENEAPRFYLELQQTKDKEGKAIGEQIFPIKLANGVVLEDGQILSLYSIPEKLKRKVQNGDMSQAKADDLSFLRFDVVLVEDADTGSKKSGKGSDDINF